MQYKDRAEFFDSELVKWKLVAMGKDRCDNYELPRLNSIKLVGLQ